MHSSFSNYNKVYGLVSDILNSLSRTKINYWLIKRLLNCNISAILVVIIKLINIPYLEDKRISYY